MTERLEYSDRATADLDDIWRYTENMWGRDQARDYLAAIDDRCRSLARGEAIATQVTVGGLALLRIRVASHVVFAREEADRMLIARILHVRQDAERHLAGDHAD